MQGQVHLALEGFVRHVELRFTKLRSYPLGFPNIATQTSSDIVVLEKEHTELLLIHEKRVNVSG